MNARDYRSPGCFIKLQFYKPAGSVRVIAMFRQTSKRGRSLTMADRPGDEPR
jgi:hypothetical protein